MTAPGARAAQQGYQQQVQNNSATFRRNAAYHQLRHRRGPAGVIRGLLGFLFSLVLIAVAAGIVLAIVNAAQPDWFDHIRTWFDQIF